MNSRPSEEKLIPMPQNSKQFIDRVKAGEDLSYTLNSLSKDDVNKFFLRDIQIQRKVLVWDRINLTMFLTIIPYFLGLIYHEHYREKLPDTRSIRRDDEAYHTAESISGFVALGALTNTPNGKKAFESLWNKASPSTRSKVLNNIACNNAYLYEVNNWRLTVKSFTTKLYVIFRHLTHPFASIRVN